MANVPYRRLQTEYQRAGKTPEWKRVGGLVDRNFQELRTFVLDTANGFPHYEPGIDNERSLLIAAEPAIDTGDRVALGSWHFDEGAGIGFTHLGTDDTFIGGYFEFITFDGSEELQFKLNPSSVGGFFTWINGPTNYGDVHMDLYPSVFDLAVTSGASRPAYLGLNAQGGTEITMTEGVVTISGDLIFSNQFTVTGSRGGNAAVASLITGFADLGILVDSTTA